MSGPKMAGLFDLSVVQQHRKSVLNPDLKADALNCSSCIGLQVCTAVMKAADKSSNPPHCTTSATLALS